jgi:hypothetical protein
VGFLRDSEVEDEEEDESQEDEGQDDSSSQSFQMPSWSEMFPTVPRPGERVQQAQLLSDAPSAMSVHEQRIPSGTPLLVGKFDPKGKFRSFPPGQVGRYRVIKKKVDDDESQEDESQEDEQDDQGDNLNLDWNEWFPQVPIPKGGQGQGVGGQQGGQLVGGRFRSGMVGGGRRVGGMRRVSNVGGRRVMMTPAGRPYYFINPQYKTYSPVRRTSGGVKYYSPRPMQYTPMTSSMSMRNPYYYVYNTRPRVRM